MKTSQTFNTLFVLLFLSFKTSAEIKEVEISPTPKKLVLNSSLSYLDNYHPRLENDISAISLSAGLRGKLVMMKDAVWVQTSYEANTKKFELRDNTSELDTQFSQYNLGLLSRFFVAKKLYVDVSGSHNYEDVYLGTGIAKFQEATNLADSYTLDKISTALVYGSDTNKYGKYSSDRLVRLQISHSDQDYENKNPYSDLYDLVRNRINLDVRYRLSELTQFETVMEVEELDFASETRPDNTLYRMLVGFEWRGTGKSRFEALIGGYRRTYEVAVDRTGFLAEIEAEYVPHEDIFIKVRTAQRTIVGVAEDVLDTLVKSANFDVFYRYREHIGVGILGVLIQTEYEQLKENRNTEEIELGVNTRISLLDHSSINLSLVRGSLEDNFYQLDYTQNKVELSWQYDF